jgi:hypothetical protein
MVASPRDPSFSGRAAIPRKLRINLSPRRGSSCAWVAAICRETPQAAHSIIRIARFLRRSDRPSATLNLRVGGSIPPGSPDFARLSGELRLGRRASCTRSLSRRLVRGSVSAKAEARCSSRRRTSRSPRASAGQALPKSPFLANDLAPSHGDRSRPPRRPCRRAWTRNGPQSATVKSGRNRP